MYRKGRRLKFFGTLFNCPKVRRCKYSSISYLVALAAVQKPWEAVPVYRATAGGAVSVLLDGHVGFVDVDSGQLGH